VIDSAGSSVGRKPTLIVLAFVAKLALYPGKFEPDFNCVGDFVALAEV